MKPFFILLALTTLIGGNINAQSSNDPTAQQVEINSNVKCKMSVEDILRQQPFDIDHYKSEYANKIITELFAELSHIYDEVAHNKETAILSHLNKINKLLESADELEMNYTMFNTDLSFVKSLK